MMAAPLKAIVLAAGYGTRLSPLTSRVPKPLLPVFGAPLLSHILERLEFAGAQPALVNASHLAPAIEAWLAKSRFADVALQREETPLGTGGALSLAQLTLALGDEPVMVHNGDIWIGETDILALITAHAAAPAHATLLVIDSSGLAASERKVGVDEHGWVTDVDGVGSPHRAAYRAGFSGIFVASGAFGTRRPGLTMACNKEHGFWPALRAGQPMRAVRAVSYWSDIGSPLQYLATHQALLALRQSPAVGDAPARQSWIHPEARVHPSAQLGPYAVIGAGATVGANARVCHAVVWDGVDVAAEATLEHAIAWWGGVLRP